MAKENMTVPSGTSAVIPVSDDEATLLFDTMSEVWMGIVQNIDPANDVYISQDRLQLNSTQGIGGANVPNVGLLVPHNGGSVSLWLFRGRMYGLALNADVGIRVEVWPIGMPKILFDLMNELRSRK